MSQVEGRGIYEYSECASGLGTELSVSFPYLGKDYPDGIVGEAIPLEARILTVVDSYSAIRDKRAYKEARSHAEAVSELRKQAGTQFDPRVVVVFLAKSNELGEFPE